MDKPRLLIVEDDLDLSDMVSSYFRVQNYDVVTAAWGEEALEMAAAMPLDLIMLDIRLPDIDGFELCRRLREKRKTQEVPIIFLTEKRDRVDKLQGLELGVVDYITKPFDIQELRLRVRNAIHRASLPSTVNPVTNLPEGSLVTEKMTVLLSAIEPGALLQLSIARLSEFRSRYGFVAADDVMRAMTLMITNAVREFGTGSDFIGHLDNGDFIIITSPDNVEDILDRVSRRIRQSREYFYPASSTDMPAEEDYLSIKDAWVECAKGSYEDLAALKQALNAVMADTA
ncbi:MAG: response regulator [Aggregatilineales bacterium]